MAKGEAFEGLPALGLLCFVRMEKSHAVGFFINKYQNLKQDRETVPLKTENKIKLIFLRELCVQRFCTDARINVTFLMFIVVN